MSEIYVGTELVMASEADKNGEPGYAVRYQDGFQSWARKKVFEETYFSLGNINAYPDFLKRLIAEYRTLLDKFNKLTLFLSTATESDLLDCHDIRLMEEQRSAMSDLISILNKRVARAVAKYELECRGSISLTYTE